MPPFKWTSENAQRTMSRERNTVWEEGKRELDLIFTHRVMWYISVSHVTQSDRYCHSMKWLCCRDFVFVQQLTGDCRQGLASLICYHLHVEHTHSSLMLTWNTGSAMCHSCKVQSAKVAIHTNTRRCAQSHTNTHTHAKGASVIQCPVPCLHFGAADETCRVWDTLRTFRSVSGCSAFITFWSTGKGLNCCCLTTSLALSSSSPSSLFFWLISFYTAIGFSLCLCKSQLAFSNLREVNVKSP